MSHSYHLRPNARGRMQRRLDAHIAAFGEQNRDKITAVPSSTGQGVHLYFDPERSLSPDPDQAANLQCADSTEGVVVIDDNDSADSSSDLESDSDTVAPNTPSAHGQFLPPFHLHAPKAPRHIMKENRSEGSVDSSSSLHDSLALIAERKKALKAHLDGDDDGEGRRRFLEHRLQTMLHQASSEEERLAIMARDYQEVNAQFRRENADIFRVTADPSPEYIESSPPGSSEHGDLPPEISHPTLPQSVDPSHYFGQGTQEDRKQQYTPLRRHYVQQFSLSPRDEAAAAESVGADGQFVVVARRVQKLGPCGTVVIDHETGDEKVVTKRYRVREEELYSIDGDGDSVMGSED